MGTDDQVLHARDASTDPRAVTVGELVGPYRVLRLVGEGPVGKVYFARNEVLGRSVVLRVVARDTGSFQTRFHEAARAVAMLDHPNIVKLYDYCEYAGGLAFVFEYVEGNTLSDRAKHGLLSIHQALRYVCAVAGALAHAHTMGVYHCGLNPSSVIIGRDGRVRIVDFRIAHVADGTPTPWRAPELSTGEPLTDRVDSWGLGVLATHLLTGVPLLERNIAELRDAVLDAIGRATSPFEGRGIPDEVVSLITQSLERKPTLRPSLAEWVRVLEDVRVERLDDAVIEDRPFRGLAPFEEKHARFYFGRELEISAFVERLVGTLHLPIVGPSGAGKSSFLHAGVIPRLRASERWTVIGFRPGADPIGTLARHVVTALDPQSDRHRRSAHDLGNELNATETQVQALRAELLEVPTLLARRLAAVAEVNRTHVLLAIDQLEEAFTLCANETERDVFLKMLESAVDDSLSRVRVVVTVRDDFVGKLAGLRSLFVLKRLGTDELRRAIAGPLALCGYGFDDAEIVDDLVREADRADVANLSLLQFACSALWDGRDIFHNLLLRATYTEMGGLAGALARHAELALAQLSPDDRRTARTLLLRLVVGTAQRWELRSSLVEVAGPDANRVLDHLLRARLLVQRDPGDGDARIELAHDSLIQTWSQLSCWLEESRDERRLLQELENAAELWQRRGRRPDETLSKDDLAIVRHRAGQLGLSVPSGIEEFLVASDQRHRSGWRLRVLAAGATFGLGSVTGALCLGSSTQLYAWVSQHMLYVKLAAAVVSCIVAVWLLKQSKHALRRRDVVWSVGLFPNLMFGTLVLAALSAVWLTNQLALVVPLATATLAIIAGESIAGQYRRDEECDEHDA